MIVGTVVFDTTGSSESQITQKKTSVYSIIWKLIAS